MQRRDPYSGSSTGYQSGRNAEDAYGLNTSYGSNQGGGRFGGGFDPHESLKRDLYEAIRGGYVDTVEKIFRGNRIDINEPLFAMASALSPTGDNLVGDASFRDCATSLHLAAKFGQRDVVRWLLENGANPQVRDGMDRTPAEVTRDPEIQTLLGLHGGAPRLKPKLAPLPPPTSFPSSPLRNAPSYGGGGDLEMRVGRVEREIRDVQRVCDDIPRMQHDITDLRRFCQRLGEDVVS